MLNVAQTWIIYPDDVEDLKRTLSDGGFGVDQKNGIWHIAENTKNNIPSDQKVTMIKDGPLKGTRVEKVLLIDAHKIEGILKKGNWDAKVTKQTKNNMILFVFQKSKVPKYEKRMLRK